MTSPTVFVVGAGRVATVIARDLHQAGVTVLGLWARREEAATAAAIAAGVPGFSVLPAQIERADCVIVAVSDASIAPVAQMLVQGHHLGAGAVLLHCAGSQSSEEAFGGLGPVLAGRGLLHPLRAIASADQASLAGTFFGIEGDPPGQAMATRLCEAMGGRALALSAAQMASYHAAAAFASNYVVALLDAACQLLGSVGVQGDLGREALCELASGAISNLRDQGLPNALTGPIRRGDRLTIQKHLTAIATHLPEGLPLYREAALWSLPIAAEIGEASDDQLSEIKDILG